MTPEVLKNLLESVRLFHYAGHGRFDAEVEAKGELTLSKNSRFDVGDILALAQAPETVILSACETATTNTKQMQESLGLAQAFIAAGSVEVVASRRAVNDKLSFFIMKHLHAKYSETGNLSQALQFAQLKAASKFPDSDWATYRLITRN